MCSLQPAPSILEGTHQEFTLAQLSDSSGHGNGRKPSETCRASTIATVIPENVLLSLLVATMGDPARYVLKDYVPRFKPEISS